jgi:hypothetical protein
MSCISQAGKKKWDYEGTNVMYFLGRKEREYHVDII